MNSAYLLIGGNIGNRLDNLNKAAQLIEASCGTVVRKSSVYETAAWGKTDQPAFYNQALAVRTNLLPRALLEQLLHIEKSMGRERKEAMGPRTIDIDILFYDDVDVDTTDLVIPHPRLHLRKFALVPMNEIAPGHIHSGFHKTIQQLMLACVDPLDVHKISPAN